MHEQTRSLTRNCPGRDRLDRARDRARGRRNLGSGDEQGTREFLVVCAIIAVAAAVVFGWVVPRGLQRQAAGATALTLSILGLLAVLAFWAG